MSKDAVMRKYVELHQLYYSTDKVQTLKEAEKAMLADDYTTAEKLLKELPDKAALQEKIYKHLYGKPVYDTLRKVLAGKCNNLYEGLKGLFSLGTHLCIELEKGNMEYRALLDDTLSAIHKHLK